MKVRTAKTAGFCFGVRRAVDGVLEAAEAPGALYTLGELIHNEHVVDRLRSCGITVVDDVCSIPAGSRAVIRSHGVPRCVQEEMGRRGLKVLDFTCPFVKRIHRKVAEAGQRPVFIVGTPEHPEVIGIRGWAHGRTFVLSDVESAEAVPPMQEALLVCQTTGTRPVFKAIEDTLRTKIENLESFDSICDTTQRRQKEAAELAAACDIMVVIGDQKSSNTAKLYAISKEICPRTLFISSAVELVLENVKPHDIIGIIAGASTPEWLIREVQARMSEMENVQDTVVLNEESETQVQEPEAAEVVVEETSDAPAAAETEAPAEPAAAEAEVVTETIEASDASAAEPAAEEDADSDASKNEETDFMAEVDKSFVFIKRGQIVTGTVVQVSDNEIIVNIGYKSDGILRKDNLTATGDASPQDMFKEGDEIEAEVVTLNDGEGNVVLSRKSIESKLKWKELLDNMDEDQIYTVKVDKVVKGGVLAKLEGYDAFIPASQLSLRYVEDLSQFVGQDLDVNMIEVDRRQRRFVLSHKTVLQARREEEEKRLYATFHKGDKVMGKVKRLTDFGAFVDIGGVDGLLHVTDISWTKVKHPQDALNVGDEIEVLILNVDPERHRISLGLKQLQPKPWDLVPQKYIKGDTVEGTVVRIMPFGAFVSLEPTIDGLIHISQVTNRRLERVEEELHIGDKVTAKILDVDPAKKRISLSLRALMDEPSRPSHNDRRDRGGDSRNRDYDGGNFNYKMPPVENVAVSVADAFSKAEEEATKD